MDIWGLKAEEKKRLQRDVAVSVRNSPVCSSTVSHLDNQIKSAVELSIDGLQKQELRRRSVQAEIFCIGIWFACENMH